MDKKIKSVIVAAVALLGFANLNSSNINNTTSSVELTNILALASANAEGSGTTLDCWETVRSDGGTQTHKTYCGDCKAILCDYWQTKKTCQK